MSATRIRTLGLGLLAIAVLIAACGGPAGPPAPPPSVVVDGETVEMAEWRVTRGSFDCTAVPSTLRSADAVQVRLGVGTTERGDDVVLVEPLDDWTGDLVVFAHGYRDADVEAGFWDGLPVTLTELRGALEAGDGAAGVAAILPLVVCPLSYEVTALLPDVPAFDKPATAFAASSYSANGYAIDVAPFETRAASAFFDELLGSPDRRFLAGASLGGAVTVAVAEQAPGGFDAGLPTCGPIGGTLLQIDYLGHAELAFRSLYPGAFEGDAAPTDLDVPVDELGGGDRLPFGERGGTSDSVVKRIEDALTAGGGVDETLGGYTVEGDDGVERPLIAYDPSDPDTLIDSFVQIFYYATTGKRDLIDRVGGVPFDNQGAIYRDAGAPVDLATIVALDGVRDETAALFEPTGRPGMPLHVLHNEWDPVVPAFHAQAYLNVVTDAGGAPLPTVEIVDDASPFAFSILGDFASGSYGHCRFPGETLLAYIEASQ